MINYVKDGDLFTVTYDSPTAQKIVRRAYLAHQMERLSYRRALQHLRNAGHTDSKIATLIGTPLTPSCKFHPSLRRTYYKAKFRHRFTITEVMQCHVAGLINEQTMIDILSTWPYTTAETFKGVQLVDGYPLDNTRRELDAGLDTGLLSREQYDEIVRAINKQCQNTNHHNSCTYLSQAEHMIRPAFHASRMYKLTYQRALLTLHHANLSSVDIARIVHVSAAAIRTNLQTAQNHPALHKNHIQVTPQEVLQARAAAMIDDQTMLNVLTTAYWPTLMTDLTDATKCGLITADELRMVTGLANIASEGSDQLNHSAA